MPKDVRIDRRELDGPRALLETTLVAVELCCQKLPRGVLAQDLLDLGLHAAVVLAEVVGRELQHPQPHRDVVVGHQVDGALLELRR